MSGGGSSPIVLLDADDASITVSWPSLKGGNGGGGDVTYNLQYRPSTDPADKGIDSGGKQLYTTLSSELTKTTARKRNLTGAGHGFWFRVSVAAKKGGRIDKDAMDYVVHRKPFKVLTMLEQSTRMEAPAARVETSPSSTYAAHVSWSKYGSGGEEESLLLGYKLQMRENGGDAKWSTVAHCLSGTEVRKKNLAHAGGYQFRIRPVLQGETGGSESALETSVSEGGNTVPYSKPSEPVLPMRARGSGTNPASGSSSRSPGILKLFRGLPKDSLLVKGGQATLPVSEALRGCDLVFLYASAHWCQPCRRYTPQLAQFYNKAKSSKSPVRIEIIFLSADHNEQQFKTYNATMPWTAVPYESDVREKLLSHIRVTGVPRLAVLDGWSGKILESNAAGKALDVARFANLVLSSKKSEKD